VRELSARGTITFGRRFFAIEDAEKLPPAALRRAGVGVLLSGSRLDDTLAEPVARLGWLWIHRTREEPQFAEQSEDYELRDGGSASLQDPRVSLKVKGSPVADDRIEVGLTATSSPTLLRLSQQFHPQWRARTGARELECVVVDGFYQGVLIPPGVDSVELSFEPLVRWAWVPQALFLLAIPTAVIWERRRSTGPEGAPPRTGPCRSGSRTSESVIRS
jgi:hypothetical protein